MAKKRFGKYGVAPKRDRTLKGTTYMSKLEMNYRKKLDILTKAVGADKVFLIEEQVPFDCIVNGKKICRYLLDFKVTYKDRVEYVDVKGVVTPIYRIKKKLVEALYGITIKEVKAKDFKL